jgi:hypothetical protein
MNNKIILLILLLFINIGLTIYLIYKCFNNKIIEGGDWFTSTANKAKDAVTGGANQAAGAITGGANVVIDAAKQAEEEARRAFEQLVFDSFEKLLGPINKFFSTVQNTTSLLEEQGARIDLTQAVKLARWESEEANNIKKILGGGGGGMLRTIKRIQAQAEGGDITEEVAVQQARETARLEADRLQADRLEAARLQADRREEARRPAERKGGPGLRGFR